MLQPLGEPFCSSHDRGKALERTFKSQDRCEGTSEMDRFDPAWRGNLRIQEGLDRFASDKKTDPAKTPQHQKAVKSRRSNDNRW